MIEGQHHSRENKSIAVDPVWIRGIEAHEFIEHNMGDGRHAHRGARVAGVGFEGGIDLVIIEIVSLQLLSLHFP